MARTISVLKPVLINLEQIKGDKAVIVDFCTLRSRSVRRKGLD